ncbi:hypothetical protein [Sphingorhabdus sp.]|uniref:hypothetical protein n=1 Tax=Sphingorhabdus sp. TaxID=1902408 RepID=UPI0025DB628D|nr:hypothetical protein [Sphingorhabdus sp.]
MRFELALEIIGDNVVGLSDYEAALQLQTILVTACEGKRDGEPAIIYQQLRRWAMSKAGWASAIPSFIKGCHDLPSFWSYIRGVSDQWEPRRQHVREALSPLLSVSELSPVVAKSSNWTGIQSAAERFSAAKAMLPVAQASIEALIAHYERGQGNGGPPLDEHEEAIKALRELHQKLGDIIKLVESEKPIPARLQREAVDFLRRSVKEVKDDLMPFTASALCMVVFSALGFPNVGSWLGAAALSIRKSSDKI